MILYICGHDFHYEMENLCRVFFPNEKITVSDTLPEIGTPEVETYLDGASGGKNRDSLGRSPEDGRTRKG